MKFIHKTFLISLIVIIIFLAVSFGLSYFSSFNDPLTLNFKKLYPSAWIGKKIVSIANADQFVDAAGKLDPNITRAAAFEVFLQHLKSENLLTQLGIELLSDEVPDELNFYKKGNPEQFQTLLANYFHDDQREFEMAVVRPSVIEANLQIYYNSNTRYNHQAYDKANAILARLKAGEKFEDIAKTDSDDLQSAQFGGDLGFFEHGQILPELEKEIVVSKVGENSGIIVSRFGLHIIRLEEIASEQGKKNWHARQIMIRITGYEDWLQSQTQNFRVVKFKRY